MVLVNVVVAERVNKVADFELSNMRDQMCQQCIRTDVERHAEKRIRGALIELAVKHATAFDFELKERVTRRKIDVIGLARIPTGHNQAARIRIGANLLQQVCNLVHAVLPGIVSSKRAPEITINWSKIAGSPAELCGVFFVSPLGPDVHAARAQVCFARVAGQKPEQLFGDPAKRNTFRSNDRKPFAQIES